MSHGAEPNVRIAPQKHAADDGGARRNEELVADRLYAVCAEIVEHDYFFALA